MKLSLINNENLTDDMVDKIVYSDTCDNLRNTTYGIVFGNSMLIKERVNTAYDAYKSGRIKKVIFSGGSNGVSNQNNDTVAEAVKMRKLAIKLGIKEEDILIDDKSNNSFENVKNSFDLIKDQNITEIAIITSEFHLKRCYAIIKKNFPDIDVIMIHSKDGFSDRDNLFLSDNILNSGRSLATYEANLLIKYAKENKIMDLDIKDIDKKKIRK